MILIRFIVILLALLTLNNAYADISVSPIIIDLVGKEADTEIAVKNFDTKNNTYVEVAAYHLLNPADRSAPKAKILDPEKEGLLVFPAKLLLLPGQTQFVRLIRTAKTLITDQNYEVDFIPKISTHLISQTTSDGVTLGVRVIVGYGARVTLRADSPSPSLSVKRINNNLIIKNTGNTLLNITSCTQRIANKATEVALPSYTLFAGQTITQKLAQASQVKLYTSFIGKPFAQYYTD